MLRLPIYSPSEVPSARDSDEEENGDDMEDFDCMADPNEPPTKTAKVAQKYAPKKPRGFAPVNSDDIDRTRAKFNEVDNTKLTISYWAKQVDAKDSKLLVGPAKKIAHTYGRTVNWQDRASVKGLNDWRDQLFRRNFGGVRKAHAFWIERERDQVLNLAETQLKTRQTLAFNKLANTHNLRSEGIMHYAGEKTISDHKSSSGTSLASDRKAPWRTASALRRQSTKWPKFKQLVIDSANDPNKDSINDSDDEDEIPDPHPDPEEAAPKSTIGKRKRKSGTATGGKRHPSKKQRGPAYLETDDEQEDGFKDEPEVFGGFAASSGMKPSASKKVSFADTAGGGIIPGFMDGEMDRLAAGFSGEVDEDAQEDIARPATDDEAEAEAEEDDHDDLYSAD